MVLDFGLIGSQEVPMSASYRVAGSHQSENLNYELVTDANQWEEIYVVPSGKTYYVTGIVVNSTSAGQAQCWFGTGAAASESLFMMGYSSNAVGGMWQLEFPTPIKFTSGTRIAVRTNAPDDVHFTLIGYEE